MSPLTLLAVDVDTMIQIAPRHVLETKKPVSFHDPGLSRETAKSRHLVVRLLTDSLTWTQGFYDTNFPWVYEGKNPWVDEPEEWEEIKSEEEILEQL